MYISEVSDKPNPSLTMFKSVKRKTKSVPCLKMLAKPKIIAASSSINTFVLKFGTKTLPVLLKWR